MRGDGLIMARPVDCLVDNAAVLGASVCWGYSPKNVLYSGWVGDDDSTFEASFIITFINFYYYYYYYFFFYFFLIIIIIIIIIILIYFIYLFIIFIF